MPETDRVALYACRPPAHLAVSQHRCPACHRVLCDTAELTGTKRALSITEVQPCCTTILPAVHEGRGGGGGGGGKGGRWRSIPSGQGVKLKGSQSQSAIMCTFPDTSHVYKIMLDHNVVIFIKHQSHVSEINFCKYSLYTCNSSTFPDTVLPTYTKIILDHNIVIYIQHQSHPTVSESKFCKYRLYRCNIVQVK